MRVVLSLSQRGTRWGMSTRSDPEGLRLGVLAEGAARAAIVSALPELCDPANVVIVAGDPPLPALGDDPLVILLQPGPHDPAWLDRADAIAEDQASLPGVVARSWLASGRSPWGSQPWLEAIGLALGEVALALLPARPDPGEPLFTVGALPDRELLVRLAQQARGSVRPQRAGVPGRSAPEPDRVLAMDLGGPVLLIVHRSADHVAILQQTLSLAPLLRAPAAPLPTDELAALFRGLSHDVRTPMFALRLIQQLLKHRDPEDELIERLEEAISECLAVVERCVQTGRGLLGR